MPITFACACGKTLKVADEHAGKRVKCPACQGVASVPQAGGDDFELVEDRPPPKVAPVLAKARPLAPPAAKPVKKQEDDFEVIDDEDDEPPRKKKSSRREDDRPRGKKKSKRSEDDEDDRPKKKSKKKKKASSEPPAGKRMLSLIGGLVAVVAGCALAYFAWESDARRVGKAIGLGVVIALGGIGAVFNGITGNFGDGDVDNRDDDDDEKGGGDWDDD